MFVNKRAIILSIVIFKALYVIGCGGELSQGLTLEAPCAPGAILPNWSTGILAGPEDRLEHDLRRAGEALEWAAVRVHRRPVRLELADPDAIVSLLDRQLVPTDADLDGLGWKMEALLPDGRLVKVFGWCCRTSRLTVVVRVGRFGDMETERRYLVQLQRTLDGPPARVRHDKFVLPSDERL